VTLIAPVCDHICQSHSAVCLPGVWQVFDAAQALKRIKPFLNWLYLCPCATGVLRTHQTHLLPSPLLWTNQLFLSKSMCSTMGHHRRLNKSYLWELVEHSKKTNSICPAWFLHHWPLHGDCSMILMAPVSVFVSKPVWRNLAPHWLEVGLTLGQLGSMSMSKHFRDFLLSFTVRVKWHERNRAEMGFKEGIKLDNFLFYILRPSLTDTLRPGRFRPRFKEWRLHAHTWKDILKNTNVGHSCKHSSRRYQPHKSHMVMVFVCVPIL